MQKAAAIVLSAIVAALIFAVLPAHADVPCDPATFYSGKQPVAELNAIAQRHTQAMADSDGIYHSSNLGNNVPNWQKVGENVGRGPTDTSIYAALMQSDGHRRNIQDPDFTEIGVGTVVKGSYCYVTQLFREPLSAPEPAPEPKPAPEPEPEPKPAPEPEPEPEPQSEPEPEPQPAPQPAPEPLPEPPVNWQTDPEYRPQFGRWMYPV